MNGSTTSEAVMGVDLVIVHTPVGGGHKAAALATARAAEARGLSVEVLDLFALAPALFGNAYVGAHLTGQRATPTFYGAAYFGANHKDGLLEPVRRGFDHVAYGALTKRVNELAPRAVVATHHLPLVVLGRARRKGVLTAPVVGVVTDYTAHACWAERGVDAFAVACAEAADDLVSHGVAREQIVTTGIPVDAAFDRIAPARSPGAHEPLRVLVTSGGFGVGPIRRVVRSFAWLPDVELTVVCGRAPVSALRRIEREAARFGVRANVLGFETNMAARIADAHIVIGKAGGLTVSETLAAGRPMLVVGAVPGNEKMNEAFVVRGGAGFAPRPSQAGHVAAWIRRADLLEPMGERAKKLVARRSADRVVELAFALAREHAEAAGPRRAA
jgi:processive 1,2-diacylglycerol beta-glucosyltransferase